MVNEDLAKELKRKGWICDKNLEILFDTKIFKQRKIKVSNSSTKKYFEM